MSASISARVPRRQEAGKVSEAEAKANAVEVRDKVVGKASRLLRDSLAVSHNNHKRR